MMKTQGQLIVVGLTLVVSLFAFGHGENHPGPNGGQIRMPGAFHTELVKQKKAFKVYLLDINFKNPKTEKSTLKASFAFKGNEKDLDCASSGDFFSCKLPTDYKKGKAKITLNAAYDGQSGAPVTYDWP